VYELEQTAIKATILNCYNNTMITHIDEYITDTIICISVPQAAGPNLDASSMLFTKHNLHHILVPLETQFCNITQQSLVLRHSTKNISLADEHLTGKT
jgi:hypothetical protein